MTSEISETDISELKAKEEKLNMLAAHKRTDRFEGYIRIGK